MEGPNCRSLFIIFRCVYILFDFLEDGLGLSYALCTTLPKRITAKKRKQRLLKWKEERDLKKSLLLNLKSLSLNGSVQH